jgi:cell surface protein SprA
MMSISAPTILSGRFSKQKYGPIRKVLQAFLRPLAVLNMAFYPTDRGPYNYDVMPSPFSRGMAQDGTLVAPHTRWGGIMRGLQTTDFEASNIEYIEFWMMDPFVYDPNHTGGDLYFNLGDVSEDVLARWQKKL